MRRLALALLAVAAALPALAQTTPPTPPAPPGMAACPATRLQMCPQIYQPVCATKRDGARQTFGNGCSASADANVISHVPGPCS